MSNPIALGGVEVYGHFSKHLGPRLMSAGLGIQFESDQAPGIHFKAAVSDEYREAVLKGIRDAMATRFPDFPETGSVWITEITEHPVDSSEWAFYLAARSVIELAYALTQKKVSISDASERRLRTAP